MSVETTHPDYDKNLPQWQKNRDFAKGGGEVKAQGTKYLRKKSAEENEDYVERLDATQFYNATGRTVTGYLGMIFRKDPIVEAATSVEDDIEDLTGSNQGVVSVARKIGRELIVTGRGGILVDMAEDSSAENKPYLVCYKAEDIINWKTERVGGDIKYKLVVLREKYLPATADEFNNMQIDQYRVLKLQESIYTVEIWRPDNEDAALKGEMDKVNYVKVQEFVPSKLGVALEEIPFIPFNMEGIGFNVTESPISDLVDVNHGHYINSSQYENALKFAGSPMLFISDPQMGDNASVVVGSDRAYMTNAPANEANAKYIELAGTSIPSIENAMASKEKKMAVLGARLLEEQKSDAEAAQTVRMRQGGEQSLIQMVANVIEESINATMEIFLFWLNAEAGTVNITVNRDFIDTRLSSQDVTALLQAYTQNAISLETFLYNMQRGEILNPDESIEDEMNRISEQADSLGAGIAGDE